MPAQVATGVYRVPGAKAAASSGDPIAVEHEVADGEALPRGAGRGLIRRLLTLPRNRSLTPAHCVVR
jgi:hypothetical protein